MKPDNIKRVAKERDELDAKLIELRAFMAENRFNQMPHVDRDLLCRQAAVMGAYLDILKMRSGAAPYQVSTARISN